MGDMTPMDDAHLSRVRYMVDDALANGERITTSGAPWAALIARLDASEARAAAAERALDELRAALAPFAELVPSSLYSEDGSEGEKYIFLLHDQSTVNQSGITGADIARARALATPQPR